MKKEFLLLIGTGLMVMENYPKPLLLPIASLGTMSTNVIFDAKNWNQNKARINQKLINKEIPADALRFKKLVLEDMDLSGMCFS